MTAVKEFFGRRKLFPIFLVILTMLSIYFFVVFLLVNYPPVYAHQPDTLPEGCISSEQAYSIAIPHIREGAQECNRIIMEIHISFWSEFGYPRHPTWEVIAYFYNPEMYGVYGYAVFVWADTGQLYHKGAQGIM
jgi:hypothetical protein